MVTIEVLIADLRHGDAGDLSGDPKARIQQLEKAGKLDSLTRVQLTTIDGQKASLQVGQRAARIVSSTRFGGGGIGAGGGFSGGGGGSGVGGGGGIGRGIGGGGRGGGGQVNGRGDSGGIGAGAGGFGGGGGGQVNSITFENVGLMLGVTPQIRRDGLVVMSIDIERSQLGPAEEGPVISKPADGEAIRAAPTETLTTQTTISAHSGQSVIVGLQQTKQQARQRELLIIATPKLLGNEPPPAER